MAADVIGIGFGPSNLALAIALAEDAPEVRPLFLERSPRFSWHRGMMIPGASMQISFLKDLACLRNPQSDFTFLCYLQAQGRLAEFVNRRRFYPSRREFHDYLEWAARFFEDVVRYGATVTTTRVVSESGRVVALDVETVDSAGRRSVSRTSRMVVASGLRPRLPLGVEPSARVWHSSQLMTRLSEDPELDPRQIVVVGAGQSAAEVVAHMHGMFPSSTVTAVLPRYGYSASDDSPFVNRIFDPRGVDDFYDASSDVKQDFHRYHSNSNYSVVDRDLIDELHERIYEESVTSNRRLEVLEMTEVIGVRDEGPGLVQLGVRSRIRGVPTQLEADVVVFATGYEPMGVASVLGEAAPLCVRDGMGNVVVQRDFGIRLVDESDVRIYLQGGTEHTHGITSSLLSTAATRAGGIAMSLSNEGKTKAFVPQEEL